MTVCIATDVYYPLIGGIAGYIKYLSDLLTAAGHTVIILTIDEKAKTTTPDTISKEKNFVKVVLSSTYAKHRDYYSQFFRPGSYGAPGWIAIGRAVNEWLKNNHQKYKIDIIEISDYGGSGIFMINDDLPPVIIIGHSSALQLARYNYIDDNAHFSVVKNLEALSYAHSDAIVAHSPLNVADLKRITGKNVLFARAPWLPPVEIDPGSISAVKDGAQIVVSGLQMTKGAAIMAEAARIVIKENKNWKVYWIGGDTHTAPGVKPVSSYLARKYTDIWNKHFIWIDKKVHSILLKEVRVAGMAIIPSIWETFNYFALEAVFYQRPLLMTENTGAAYLFIKDKNVITIPSGSAELLADSLLHQCNNKWRGSITTESKEMLLDYFSPENIIEERIKLYNDIIKNRQPHFQIATEALEFLNQYTTLPRKLYYSAKRITKRIVKGK